MADVRRYRGWESVHIQSRGGGTTDTGVTLSQPCHTACHVMSWKVFTAYMNSCLNLDKITAGSLFSSLDYYYIYFFIIWGTSDAVRGGGLSMSEVFSTTRDDQKLHNIFFHCTKYAAVGTDKN